MEFDLQTSQIRVEKESRPDLIPVSMGDYELVVRAPNSLDLLAISADRNPASARYRLLERCLITANHDSQPVTADDLPLEVVEAIESAMETADPQANIQLNVSCPACGSSYAQTLDIVSFFWSELSSWAAHLLYDVHRLASAYGWSERDILSMSSRRRRFYLDLIYA